MCKHPLLYVEHDESKNIHKLSLNLHEMTKKLLDGQLNPAATPDGPRHARTDGTVRFNSEDWANCQRTECGDSCLHTLVTDGLCWWMWYVFDRQRHHAELGTSKWTSSILKHKMFRNSLWSDVGCAVSARDSRRGLSENRGMIGCRHTGDCSSSREMSFFPHILSFGALSGSWQEAVVHVSSCGGVEWGQTTPSLQTERERKKEVFPLWRLWQQPIVSLTPEHTLSHTHLRDLWMLTVTSRCLIPVVIVWFSAVTLCVSGSSNKQTSWSPNKAQKHAAQRETLTYPSLTA